MIERVLITSREQWLELRKPDITASIVAAVFSAHPYVSALKLHLSKRGVEFPDPDSEVLRRGRIMEPAVGAAVADARPDWRIEKCQHYFRDPERRIGGSPDFLIVNDPRGLGVLQAKTALRRVYERDWEDNRVPKWIAWQTLTEAWLTEAAFAAVAVMVLDPFDVGFHLIEVPLNAEAMAEVLAGVAAFWDGIDRGIEPDIDPANDGEIPAIISPREVAGNAIDLRGDNELLPMLAQRERIMENIAGYEARKAAIETAIKFKMRDAEKVVGLADWSITWKTQHRSAYSVAAKDTRILRITHHGGD